MKRLTIGKLQPTENIMKSSICNMLSTARFIQVRELTLGTLKPCIENVQQIQRGCPSLQFLEIQCNRLYSQAANFHSFPLGFEIFAISFHVSCQHIPLQELQIWLHAVRE